MPARPGSAISSQSQVPVKRACDACHRRKVKCIGDGNLPCKNCGQAGLQCTFNKTPQKKGPKGCRAKVISELRETQRQNTFYLDDALPQLPTTSQSSSLVPLHSLIPEAAASHSPPLSSLPRPLPALSPDLVDYCIDFFFENVYPTQPILDRNTLQVLVASMHHSVEAYCLITALCAYMMIQPNMRLPSGSFLAENDDQVSLRNISLGTRLLGDALEARKGLNYIENPHVNCVITSFFFFGCYFCLEKHNTAWYHLREATTLALFLRMHQEESYREDDALADLLKRRLFWVLFVTERAYAIQAQRPLTLHASIALPDMTKNAHETVMLAGFNHLIRLFRPFDDTFVGMWNHSIKECTTDWIKTLQKQLAEALPAYLDCTETQAVDLRTSQQWLRIMVWQLSINHRLLSSTSADEAMTFRHPVNLSRDLLVQTSHYSQAAMEVHGIGLIKKLFDVACTLIDVMACVPIEHHGFEISPRDHLNQFFQLMAKLRGGRDRYLPLLLAKANDALPTSPNLPIQLALPSMHAVNLEDVEEQGEEVLQSPMLPTCSYAVTSEGESPQCTHLEIVDHTEYTTAMSSPFFYNSKPGGLPYPTHQSLDSG